MLKYVFIFMTIFSFSAAAQSQLHDETIDVEITAPAEEERNIIYLPECNDRVMMSEVINKIKQYQEKNPVTSIVDKRKYAMMIKNLKGFEEISVEDFDNKKSYNVASEIVMTKINHQIKEDEMRLCIDNSKVIYLLIYPEGENGFRVQIINFVPRDSTGNKFSVLYIPHDVSSEAAE